MSRSDKITKTVLKAVNYYSRVCGRRTKDFNTVQIDELGHVMLALLGEVIPPDIPFRLSIMPGDHGPNTLKFVVKTPEDHVIVEV